MKPFRTFSYLPLLLLGMAIFVSSCRNEEDTISTEKQVADYSAEASYRWNEMFLQIERYAAGYRPTPAPRALGFLGLASYEACVSAMPDYNSLTTRFAGMQLPKADPSAEYHWPTVVHAVYETLMPNFFNKQYPTSVHQSWEALIQELDAKYLAEAGQEVFNRSKTHGEAVALAMWAYSATDPYGHNAFEDPFSNYGTGEQYSWADEYSGPGDWVPTPNGPEKCMFPYAGKARTFVLTEAEKICLPPSAYFMEYSENPNSEYYSQAIQVYTKNATQDYITEWVGEFWSDDLVNLTFSPGPRWTAIANQCIQNEQSNLETALEVHAKNGLALADAATACWNSKYYYNVERPYTYIQKVIDPTYETNLYNPLTSLGNQSPAFPAYPSGHSTMGAAGAEAIASVFGYSYAMTDKCHLGRSEFEGTPRTFGSLYEMAQENAWSRVLLGVHWRMDSDEGVRFGTAIARKVNALPWKK